jgi:hypothetical protein
MLSAKFGWCLRSRKPKGEKSRGKKNKGFHKVDRVVHELASSVGNTAPIATVQIRISTHIAL